MNDITSAITSVEEDANICRDNVFSHLSQLHDPDRKIMGLIERYHTLTGAERKLLENEFRPARKIAEALKLPSLLFANDMLAGRTIGNWMLHAFQASLWNSSSNPPWLPANIDVSRTVGTSDIIPKPENCVGVEHILLDASRLQLQHTLVTFYNRRSRKLARIHFNAPRMLDQVTLYALHRYGQAMISTEHKALVETFSEEDKEFRELPLPMILSTKQTVMFQLIARERNGKEEEYLNLPIFFGYE